VTALALDTSVAVRSWFNSTGPRFLPPLLLSPATADQLPQVLARLLVAGGAVYDALVALDAVEHGAELATRDARARPTYEAVGARVVIAA